MDQDATQSPASTTRRFPRPLVDRIAATLPAVSLETFIHAAALFASAAVAVWVFVIVRTRRRLPGRNSLGWLALGVALWCLTSGLHAVIFSAPTRTVLTQIQYVGISMVPPLWLLFAGEYARQRWTSDRLLRQALWIIPVATILLAFTNPLHGLVWTDVVPAGTRLRYVHGAWFWVALTFNYAAFTIGAAALGRALVRWPLPHRRQLAFVLLGGALPMLGNLAYLLELLPDALDPTPIAFALTGVCLLWGLYYHQLLALVPIARDLVIERMEEGVLVLDSGRTIVDLNPAAVTLTGCPEDCLGGLVEQVVPWWNEASEPLVAGVPAVIAVGPRILEVQLTPVHDTSNVLAGWLVVIRDITAQRTAQAERETMERRVHEQQRAESLSVLAAGLAHDFNNLLTAILGNADLVAIETAPGSSIHASAEQIIIGAQRAADLVDKLLAYAGEGKVAPEAVDLDALVTDMYPLLTTAIAGRCTLDYEGNGALPRVRADPRQIRHALLNLVTNAVEASPDGAVVTITTGVEELSKSMFGRLTFSETTAAGPHAFLDIADIGSGIDDATMKRAFDPFFSTKDGGRGLGLAAVQGIVRSHRGALRIESRVGRGTRVRMWLPVIGVDEPQPLSPTAAPPAASGPRPIRQSSSE